MRMFLFGLVVGLLPLTAFAQALEPVWTVQAQGGISRTPAAGGRTGAALFLEAVRVPPDRSWSLQPVATVGTILGKGTARDQANRTVGVLAAGGRLNSPSGVFLEVQGALIAPRTAALSSTGQFASALGWQGARWGVLVRHLSNGGTHGRNAGETLLLGSWRF
jgi:hypothetical protein